MWNEQAADQDSAESSPVLESTIVEGGEDHVLVKLLTSNGGVSSSNGSEVLTKLLTGSSSSAVVGPTVSVGTYLLTNFQSPGFRKIEPKPSEADEEEEKDDVDKSGRLLGINATRRGVKTCPQCLKKIGYRSKQCKYCCPAKQGKRSRKSQGGSQAKRNNEDLGVKATVSDNDEREVNPAAATVDMSTVMVENETEVSTTEMSTAAEVATKDPGPQGDTAENCERDSLQTSNGDGAQAAETETPQEGNGEHVIGKKVYQTSLQDLIHTLLAQNQSSSIYITPDVVPADPGSSDEHGSDQKDDDQVAGESTEGQDQESTLVPTATTEASPENAYDANSVALFLGHLAQQNGKKMRSVLNPVTDNTQASSSSASLIGVKTKHAIVIDDELSTPAKYRRIRPKSVGEGSVMEGLPTLAPAIEEEESDSCVEVKLVDPQCRMLPGNATRRGVMPCQRCQSLIGCRSKVCKHCKFLLNETNPPYKRSRKQLRQAVQLHIPTNSAVTVFSVRRSKVGPDHRCFVWCEKNQVYNRRNDSVYSCDYPPCVTAKELGDKSPPYLCEHAKVCHNPASINKGRILELHQDKLSSEVFSQEVSDSLKLLNRQCIGKGVPLVQTVSDRTFVVIDHLQTEQNSSLATDLIGFVHVRFERNKANGCCQAQVVCSGRPCMAWNPVFSSSKKGSSVPTVIRSLNCIHYSACLWGITSDKVLEKDFGLYLEAAQVQVRGSKDKSGK